MAITFPDDVGKMVVEIVVGVLGPLVYKKIRDREIREAVSHAADAALVLAIKKSNKFATAGELLREVVTGILEDPKAPNQVKKNPALAERAAAAAIARNSLGMFQPTL